MFNDGKAVVFGVGPIRQKKRHLGSSSGGHGDNGLLSGLHWKMKICHCVKNIVIILNKIIILLVLI